MIKGEFPTRSGDDTNYEKIQFEICSKLIINIPERSR